MNKVFLPIHGNVIATRFDLAREVLIVSPGPESEEQRNVILPRPSAEMTFHLGASGKVYKVICGGIEEEYLQCLEWKKSVEVVHSVFGPVEAALDQYYGGVPRSRDILFEKRKVCNGYL